MYVCMYFHIHTHRYAHGYEDQDGPHWLGGYDDINEAGDEKAADSVSGEGLPGEYTHRLSHLCM